MKNIDSYVAIEDFFLVAGGGLFIASLVSLVKDPNVLFAGGLIVLVIWSAMRGYRKRHKAK